MQRPALDVSSILYRETRDFSRQTIHTIFMANRHFRFIRTLRQIPIMLALALLGGCTDAKTPSCTDATVVQRIIALARNAIGSELLQEDPSARTSQVTERLRFTLVGITSKDYERTIDKHTCAATLHVSLPPEIAGLRDHRAFQVLALGDRTMAFQGNDLVALVSYTTYLSQEDQALVIRVEGETAPARFIRAAYKVGAFDADLTRLPDLHKGLTLYAAAEKSLLIKPADDGLLQFQISYENNYCRPWAQLITEERGDRLIYDNPEVGCSVAFSRLGEILLVEHAGCDKMAPSCSPDGIYQKQ